MENQPEYGELGFDDSFNFTCGEHVSCFVDCCTGTKVWLYPYDVIRISLALNLTSGEFIRQHTYILEQPPVGYPVLLLRRADEGEGRCVFAEDSGCTIYLDRPWICRLFPVSPVECRTDTTSEAERRFNILVWEGCRGVGNGPAVTIREWWQRAGMAVYEETYLDWQRLVDELKNSNRLPLTDTAAEQFKLAFYDPDLFREMLLAGELPDSPQLEKAELESVENDDILMLKIACRWLQRILLGDGF